MSANTQNKNTNETVKDHFRELRNRFFICVFFFLAFGVIVYLFCEPILDILSSLLGDKLYYNDPSGGFSVFMKISTAGAIILSMPVIVYNIIKFASPAFEKAITVRKIALTTVFSSILALVGASFAYFCILPQALEFFSGFQIGGLNALITADSYLSFIINLIAFFAIIFQVPLLMLLIDSVKSIPPSSMIKMEKWVVVISLVVAIIAPFNYDLISTLLVSVPIILLYNLSIGVILARHQLSKVKESKKVLATFVKPAILSQEILVSELTMDAFNEDFSCQEEITKVTAPVQKSNHFTKQIKSMEFVKTTNQTAVKPATQLNWIERKQQLERQQKIAKISQNKNVKVFSDFVRAN